MDKDIQDVTILLLWDSSQIDRLLCTLCFYLLFPPMQLICCGQRICTACATNRLKQFSQCPFCSEPGIPEARQDKGYKRELDRLQVNCPRCNDKGPGLFTDLLTHLNDHCDLVCENCDEKFIFPQQLKKHQSESCKNRIVSCPLDFLGCSHKVPYNRLSEHYLSNEHQQCLFVFVTEVFPRSSHGQMNLTLQKSLNEPYQRALTEYSERIDSLIEEINRIIENCVHLNSEREIKQTKINEIREQSTKIKESFDNSAHLIDNLHQTLVNMHKLLDEIKSKPIAGPKLMSSDSIYTWKVNFLELIHGRLALQSEPVHSSQSGYKMALSCEIYVDEKYQKRYISVSFIILPGEFDAIISWPFHFPITLTLVDLTVAKKHITRSILRDSRTEALDRPLNNTNTVAKIVQFSPVDVLENNNNYIQDGSMFLEMYVDFTTSSVHPVSNKEEPMVTYDSIQTNILSNIPMKSR